MKNFPEYEIKKASKTIVLRPVVLVLQNLTPEEKLELRLSAKTTDGIARIYDNENLFAVYDMYVVEQLSLAKLVRHHLRKFFTTIASKIGMGAGVIVVESAKTLPVMNGAAH